MKDDLLETLLSIGIYGSLGFGVYQAIDGIGKIGEATAIEHEIQASFQKYNNEFGACLEETDISLKELGKVKLAVWEEFKDYIDAFSKIHKIAPANSLSNDEFRLINNTDMDEIKRLNCTAQDIAKEGLITISEGILIEIGLSTFFKINGINKDDEIKVLGGIPISCATAISATALIGGFKINKYGKERLQEAKDYAQVLSKSIDKMNEHRENLRMLTTTSNQLKEGIKKLLDIFKKYVLWLKAAVILERDFTCYSRENQRRLLFIGQLASVLKDLTLIKLLSVSENEEHQIDQENLRSIDKSIDLIKVKIETSIKEESESNTKTMKRGFRKIYPNDSCPCGSGYKYKNCCKAYVDRNIILNISA